MIPNRFLDGFQRSIRPLRHGLRFRLVYLICIPVLITMSCLVVISTYWAIKYTWPNLLKDVEQKITIGEQQLNLWRKDQHHALFDFIYSDAFQSKLVDIVPSEINHWLEQSKPSESFDYLRWVPRENVPADSIYQSFDHNDAFYERLKASEIIAIDPSLYKGTQVIETSTNELIDDALVIRCVFPIKNRVGEIIGYLDGGTILNNNHRVVDTIRDNIYANHVGENHHDGSVTLFLGDLRVSTNVTSQKTGGRVIGTRASDEVTRAVLDNGETFIDRALVFDDWAISAYKPLYNHNNQIVGMFYTGYSIHSFFQSLLITITEVALATVAVTILSSSLVYKHATKLVLPLKKIVDTVTSIKSGRASRIGDLNLSQHHELTLFAAQFDTMMDLLETKQKQIDANVQQLENRLLISSASLKRKSKQLDNHIQQLNSIRNKLIESEKLAALGKLTAGIAHEINNPITIILGNVELLKIELNGSYPNLSNEMDSILSQIDRKRLVNQ